MSTSGGSPDYEQSFADVLNNLTYGPRRPAHRAQHEADHHADHAADRQSDHRAEWEAERRTERHARRVEPPAEQTLDVPWLAPAARSDPEEGMGSAEARWAAVAEEWGEPEDFGSAVRPYSWTKGRTRPAYELEVETLVSTSEQGRDIAGLTSVEHRAVAELCRQPRSVAEVGALLSLPLGVARVLLGDMADVGLVKVHRTATGSGERPDLAFMERVLSGLRRL